MDRAQITSTIDHEVVVDALPIRSERTSRRTDPDADEVMKSVGVAERS